MKPWAKRFWILLSIAIYVALFFLLAKRTSELREFLDRYSFRFAFLLGVYVVGFFPYVKLVRFLFREKKTSEPKHSFLYYVGFLRYGIPILLCLLPLEIFLRLNYGDFFQDRDIRRFHPFLQIAPLRNDKTLHVNSHGFRGDEITKEKPKDVFRIFFLGGSTVFSGEQFYENTHVGLFEHKLRERYPDRKIEILNAGYQWYTTEHSLIQYLFKIKDYDPDLIIMWHGVNDFYRSFLTPRFTYGKFESDYSHFHGPVARVAREHFKPAPVVRFHLVSMVYLIREFYSKISADKVANTLFKPVEISDFPSLAPFKRNLISMVQATKADHVELILGTQPVLYREGLNQKELDSLWVYKTMCLQNGKYPNLKSATLAMNKFNQATRTVAESYGVTLIDLDAQVPKSEKYFWDDCHYTKEGQALVGEKLFQFVVDGGFLERKKY